MCHLTVLCSETDVGKPTTWTEHEASSCAFGFGDERRCLVVLNRFCLITVVCKDTPDQMQVKTRRTTQMATYRYGIDGMPELFQFGV